MAVIGAKNTTGPGLLKAFVLAWAAISICQAQENQGIRDRLSDVAMALTSGNPSNALEPFDKSFDGYQKLSDYFIALTNAYQVANEVEVTDEQDAGNGVEAVSVHWTLHLTDAQTNNTESRSGDMTLQMVRKKGKWKIVSLTPLTLFDPQQTQR